METKFSNIIVIKTIAFFPPKPKLTQMAKGHEFLMEQHFTVTN